MHVTVYMTKCGLYCDTKGLHFDEPFIMKSLLNFFAFLEQVAIELAWIRVILIIACMSAINVLLLTMDYSV